jgi:hypothetical protein
VPDRVVNYVFRGNFTNLGAGLTTMGKGVGDLGTQADRARPAGRDLSPWADPARLDGRQSGWSRPLAWAPSCSRLRTSSSPCPACRPRPVASADGLGDLRTAAIKAGAATVFSATEAADAITAMAKAGVSPPTSSPAA